MRALQLLTALLLALAGPARAAFEDTGAGARAPAMGDAFTALADDAYAIHYNPAGLAQLERPQLGAAYSRLYQGLSDGSEIGTSQLAYAHPLMGGKKGTLATSWERFSLSGLYQEQAFALGYGRRVLERRDGRQLSVGATMKYLQRSFTRTQEAASSCSSGLCGGAADPVLSGANAKSVPDLDLGVLYRFPRRFQLGLAIRHLTEPNIAFSGTDKLRRSYDAGLAYKSLWLSLVGELKLRPAADGSTSRDIVLAAERIFPTLDRGQFGVRGSLGVGTGDWRQLAVGGSYRINKIQADYAYLVPFGGVASQGGSHRVGMSFHFGAPSADEQLGRELLEETQKMKARGPSGYAYEYSPQIAPQALDDARLADVRKLIGDRRYRAAHRTLTDFGRVQPLGAALERLLERLDKVAYHYGELEAPRTRGDKALIDSIERYLAFDDRKSILSGSYAYDLLGRDARVDGYLTVLEKGTGLKGERLPDDHPRRFFDELMWKVEYAHTRGDAVKSEALLADALYLEPDNVMALERLGSQRYLAGRYSEAIDAWETALKHETREDELKSLLEYLVLAREQSSGKALPGGVAPAPAPAPAAAPAPVPRSGLEVPVPTRRGASSGEGDLRDVERLYQNGVERYARGEYLEASAMFLRILRIDPSNEQARRALERIDRRRSGR